MNREADKPGDRQTNKGTDRQTRGQTDKRGDRQTNEGTDGRTG